MNTSSILLEINKVRDYLLSLQQQIISMLEKEDASVKFLKDTWEHSGGGGGITYVCEDADIIEKAGVNFSHVTGERLPQAATAKRVELTDARFEAQGVSVIIHPRNPYVPTTHFNVRFIIAETNEKTFWWFGGGFDLTPYYGFKEDAVHWHTMAKQACEPFGKNVYARFKKWCDEYFYLKHRNEARGIGGIFFDDLNEWDFATCFAFMQQVGKHFILAYQPILNKRKLLSYGERERLFQTYRRGRYVEFNLLYDRGTLFGLQSGGRVESILMSLPPLVRYVYQYCPELNSPEENLYKDFLPPREWIEN